MVDKTKMSVNKEKEGYEDLRRTIITIRIGIADFQKNNKKMRER